MKAKSFFKLLVIKEICSWLPPGWRDGKFAAKNGLLQIVCELSPYGLRGCNPPWFICWFWRYINCSLLTRLHIV